MFHSVMSLVHGFFRIRKIAESSSKITAAFLISGSGVHTDKQASKGLFHGEIKVGIGIRFMA